MKKHIHTIHDGHKDYKCGFCAKSFTQVQHLKTHIHTVHEGHKDHKCEYCSKSFLTASDMEKHVCRIPIIDNIDKCDICGKVLKESKLRKHMISIHSINLLHLSSTI